MRRLFAPFVVLAALALAAPGAYARMYEWKSPTSGAVHLSGTPPTWYRTGEPGPRVRVFDNGRLVDDTAIPLPAAHAQELRDAAFHELKERRRLESLRKLEVVARRDAARKAEAAHAAAERKAETAHERAPAPKAASVGSVPAELSPAVVDRLKAIVSEFDRASAARDAAARAAGTTQLYGAPAAPSQ